MSYQFFRDLLFLLPPETSHNLSLGGISLAEKLKLTSLFLSDVPSAPVNVMGIDFPNPVGLAAGLDKNGDHIAGLGALGFGFIEVGTVTPRPQPGNPKPRLFRIPERQAIINRMGFNNKGVDHLVGRVKVTPYSGIVGINIGKNFDTPVEQALDDYIISMKKAYQHADYITVNISSPNTPGLRNLQFGDSLRELLSGLKEEQRQLAEQHNSYKPIAVKIAPDMDNDEVKMVASALKEYEMDGVIATNTTLSRDAVKGLKHAEEAGGLSGAPVTEVSTSIVEQLRSELSGKMPIIAAGGIVDSASAKAKFEAGATLVQLYTGFIYAGPKLIRDVVAAYTA